MSTDCGAGGVVDFLLFLPPSVVLELCGSLLRLRYASGVMDGKAQELCTKRLLDMLGIGRIELLVLFGKPPISSVRVTPLVRATHSAAAASGTIISNSNSRRLSSATVLSPASSRGQEHDCQHGAVSMPKPTAHLGRNRCFVAGR